MWTRSLDYMLRHLIHRGALSVEMPSGEVRRYGEPEADAIHVRLTDPDLPRKLVLNPDLALGEAYMDQSLTVEGDDLEGFMALLIANRAGGGRSWILDLNLKMQKLMRGIRQRNTAASSKSNVAHHYDLSSALYELFLDEDRQYSCAYFRRPDDSLEQAQAQKKAHIADKLLIRPDMRVLDIGCGWGGMAIFLAQNADVTVHGITLSEQNRRNCIAYALRRASTGIGRSRCRSDARHSFSTSRACLPPLSHWRPGP